MKREEKIKRLIELAWSSLESHLDWTHKDSSEGKKFHKRCVKEYSEMIKLLSELI